MKNYVAGESTWRTAQDEPPPRGVKMLLLNPGGVCVVGVWHQWAVAWAPLPRLPEHVKRRLLRGLEPRSSTNTFNEWQRHAGDAA